MLGPFTMSLVSSLVASGLIALIAALLAYYGKRRAAKLFYTKVESAPQLFVDRMADLIRQASEEGSRSARGPSDRERPRQPNKHINELVPITQL